MALTSPRFRNESALRGVDAGHAILRFGAHGRHVHLLQIALVDLGFSMPVSTLSRDYSPDGVYGRETRDVVKAFQRSTPRLSDDGEVGPLTMRALDARFPKLTHRVNLHFRSLALSDVPFNRIMGNCERVYTQYGIEARFASGESLGLSAADQRRFSVVRQNCDWAMESGEFADLHRLGTRVPTNDVAVYIVNLFQETTVGGCGGHAANRPACAVTHDCGPWDVGHELAHVLLTSSFTPEHTISPRNLMFSTSSTAPEPPAFTEKQLKRIRESPLCRTI